MNRFQLFCFLALISFSAVYAQSFNKITFSKGKTVMPKPRMLDGVFPNTSISHVTSEYSYSFPVIANFSGNYTGVNDLDYLPEMQILIYSSQSAVAAQDSECNLFDSPVYYCTTQMNCTENTTTSVNLTLPFFNSTGMTSISLADSPIVSLANDSWKTSSLLYIHNCNYDDSDDYMNGGDEVLGWIGLGLSAGGNENFMNSANPLFSILINSDASDDRYGELLFGYDANYVNTSSQPVSLITDADWQTNITGISWEIYNSTTSSYSTWSSNFESNTTLVFDVQYQGIGLPYDQYRSIMTYLITLSSVEESDDEGDDDNNWDCYYGSGDLQDDTDLTDLESCTWEGDVSILQDFKITLGNGTILSIPSTAYLDGSSTMFKHFDSSLAGANYTVFGTHVMKNFYTVFNQSNGINYITLYPRLTDLYTSPPDESTNPSTIPPINTTEPTVNTTEPVVNTTDPNINITEPVVNTTDPNINVTEPVTNTTTSTAHPDDTTTTTPVDNPDTETSPNPVTTTTPISDETTTTTTTTVTDDSASGTNPAIIIAIVLVVLAVSAGIVFLGIKMGWWLQPKVVEEPSFGVELRSGINRTNTATRVI